MLHKWLEIASTPAVRAARERYGSAAQYARLDGTLDEDGSVRNDRLGEAEATFIADRDGFYVASVSETGWPYVQYRGGPAGFLRILDERTLGFADFRGNRQHVTMGNVAANERVSLFLMDYAHQRRLKIFGRARVVDANEDPRLAASLAVAGYPGRVERAVLIEVEAFDWNCPQHITPRFTLSEFDESFAPCTRRSQACMPRTSVFESGSRAIPGDEVRAKAVGIEGKCPVHRTSKRER